MPLIMPKVLPEEELDRIRFNVDSQITQNQLVAAHLAALHRDTKISITLPTEEIKRAAFSYNLVKGKASLAVGGRPSSSIITDCFVATGRWNQLGTLSGPEINLMDHLKSLLPKCGSGIGLFTCQNGIQNGLDDDFQQMCNSIIKNLAPEKPLFIGLYNKTSGKGYGLPNDLNRMLDAWTHNFGSALTLRQLFATIAPHLQEISQRLLWTHIAHSEGGLLSSRCLTDMHWGLTPEQKRLVKSHLITMIYGGVDSIPNSAVRLAINNYSIKDIAFRFARPYLDKAPSPEDLGQPSPYSTAAARKASGRLYIQNYPYKSTKEGRTITLLKCISKSLPIVEGDHAFAGDTYQKALKDDITDLRNNVRIL